MTDGYRIILVLAILAGAFMLPVAADDTTAGGDQGWYRIYCNVYGAKIYLDDKFVGMTPQAGPLTVAVSTNSAYKTIRVQKYGYSTFTDSVTRVPLKGETVDLFTTLNEIPATTATAVGGDVGWYILHCNIDGATVLFDDSNRGEISQGMLYVPVYSTGTPYTRYTVKKDGYTTFTGNLPNVPGKGQSLDLYATLNPVATTPATPEKIGSDIGWYAVHCNVEGATVSFDNDAKGQIVQGNLTVQVYVTGTPYKTFTVYKSGYVPYTGTIDRYPAKGQTVDLYATLNAQPATTKVPTSMPTQKSPLAGGICALALVFAGAVVSIVSRK